MPLVPLGPIHQPNVNVLLEKYRFTQEEKKWSPFLLDGHLLKPAAMRKNMCETSAIVFSILISERKEGRIDNGLHHQHSN